MANYRYMMSAEDIAKELNCSKSHAYKIVKRTEQGTCRTGVYYNGRTYSEGVLGKENVRL